MNHLTRHCSIIALTTIAVIGTCAAEDKLPASKPDAVCAGCHGPGGSNPVAADTPRLAGQAEDYLAHALRDYRSGARPNAIMSAMASPLSDVQIQDLAHYFAAQPGLTTKY